MKILKYILTLVPKIYISAFNVVVLVIKTNGKPKIKFEKVWLETKETVYQGLICQGITLTPGTLVLEKRGNEIVVLKFKKDKSLPHIDFDKIFSSIKLKGTTK